MSNPSTKVMEVFSSAVLYDAAQRAVYLERACNGDRALRAEVESLLTTQDRLSGFLDSPTVEEQEIGRSGNERFREADSIEAGPQYVGRYRISERIGEGGFGVVYAACQEKPIRREVALKVVKLGMDTRQIISRFESERQALALMDHPNIARIFDAGATVDGRPYFVMERVHGLPITDYCDQHRLSIARRLELFMAVCQAVQHAHQKGIIHRDLKPSNILVADIDGLAVPKVIDFGIAKAIQSPRGERTSFTEQRHFLGTPQYMSPEQAGAGDGDLDTRSDIYSLGILLYELLVGATPFDANTLRDSSFEDVNRMIREQEPPRPSAMLGSTALSLAQAAQQRGLDQQKLRKTIRGELDWVVMKAIEKDRRQRYETISALAEDIRRYLAHEPVSAGPRGALYRARKFSRKYRGPLLAAAAIALVLIAGLAGTTIGLMRAKRDRDRAEAALSESREVSAFLSMMLQSANPDAAKGGQVLVRDVLDRTSASLARGALKDHPNVEAGIRGTLGRSYESLGLYSQSEAQFRAALDIRRHIAGNDTRDIARLQSALAFTVSQRADFDEAEKLAREALATQEKLFGKEHPELIDTLLDLGLILRSKGDVKGAEEVHRRAVQLSRKFNPHSSTTSIALTDLAVVLMNKGDYDGAEPLFREGLALDRKLHGDKFRNVPRNLSNLAVIYEQRGDLDSAEKYWLQALAIQRQMLPGDHPDTGWTLKLLGRLKRLQQQYAAAEDYSRQAFEMETKVFGPTHPVVVDIMHELSMTVGQLGRREESVALQKRAYTISRLREESAVAAHPDSAEHQSNLGELLVFFGDFAGARTHLAQAVALRDDPHDLILRACLDRHLDDNAAYEQACQILLRDSERLKGYLAVDAAIACMLRQPAAADLPRIARLVPRIPQTKPIRFDALSIGLADLRSARPQLAWTELANARKNATGTIRAIAGFYLAIALHRAGNDANSRATLHAAMLDFAELPTLKDGYLGPVADDWLMAQIARREALAELGDVDVASCQPFPIVPLSR